MAVGVEFPVSPGICVRRIENWLLEEVGGHLWLSRFALPSQDGKYPRRCRQRQNDLNCGSCRNSIRLVEHGRRNMKPSDSESAAKAEAKKREREKYVRMLREIPPGTWRKLPPMVSIPVPTPLIRPEKDETPEAGT